MFRIGEFSRLTQVSIRMLRYYDETGLLKPSVTDPATGYCLYAAQQIPRLQRILLLRDVGFHVAEIQDALKRWDSDFAVQLLAAKKWETAETIRREEERIRRIEMAIQDVRSSRFAVHCNVTIRQIPSEQILSLRDRIPDYFCEGDLWERLFDFIHFNRIEAAVGGSLTIFHEEEHPGGGIDVEVGVKVKRAGENRDGFIYRKTEPVDTMACIMVYGPYENIGPAYHSFAHWLEEHQQYEMDGPIRQIVHVGAFEEADPAQFLTEVQTPIRVKRERPSADAAVQDGGL